MHKTVVAHKIMLLFHAIFLSCGLADTQLNKMRSLTRKRFPPLADLKLALATVGLALTLPGSLRWNPPRRD